MALVSAGINVTTRFLKWAVPSVACFLLSFSTAYAAGWVSTTQPNAPDAELCHALLYRLNHTSPRCTATAVATYPGFQSPPWETLDANKYINLIAKLSYIGGPTPVSAKQMLAQKPPPDWKYALAGAKEFVQEGGSLQIWDTRLLAYFGDTPKDPAPPGAQTIALLSTKPGSRAIAGCPESATFRWSRTYVVLPDLSGPDLRVDQGTASILANNYPVLYKGQTLLINKSVGYINGKLYEGSQVMFMGTGTRIDVPVCWFQFHRNDRNSGEK